ncbi:MAG: hypothetical protein ABR971_00535 [Acidobacteriaceae bacterium]|jgi:hypothetical protein
MSSEFRSLQIAEHHLILADVTSLDGANYGLEVRLVCEYAGGQHNNH